jgi:uncharacterized protein (TIGR03437 family)
MMRHAAVPLLALLIAAGVQAATIQTTISMNSGTLALNTTTFDAIITGPVTLTNLGSGGVAVSGQFSASASPTSISGTSITAPFTITFSATDSLTGTISLPATVLSGSSFTATGSLAVTGGAGAYNGTKGSFPSVSGQVGGSLPNLTLSFSGNGTLTTGGSTGGSGGTGGTGATAPAITAVLDAGSYTSSIAQGSIFVVKGTNLSASGYNSFGFPLPQSSGGVSITFTPAAGGTGANAYLIYTYNENGVNQLAAILPSTLAAGNYNVTVTNGTSTSANFAATVVQRKAGLLTQDASGSGLVLAQNVVSPSEYDVDRFTTGTVGGLTISPAKPGQTLVAYATGLGGVTGGDNVASSGYNFEANGVNVQVIVGGASITPAYAGRTPTLAGLDQINFTLPSNVTTGCTVSFQVSVNGVLSAPAFISIAPSASASACVQPGFTTSQLENFDNGGTYVTGGFSITQIQESETVPTYGNLNVKIDAVGGSFEQFTGFQLAAASQYNVSISTSGACQVITVSGTSGGTLVGSSNVTFLDAGAVSLNGPSGSGISNAALTETSTNYSYSLALGYEGFPVSIPGSLNATLVAGTYTLSAKGGKDVGSFNVSISLGSPLVLNPALPSTVTRSAGLPLSWTGGNSSDVVEIIGYSGTTTTSGTTSTVNATEFVCTTTAGTGGFTVPASVLSQLPATASTTSGGTGFLEVSSGPAPTPFSPSLTAGGNVSSIFGAFIGTGALVTYQ